MIALPWWVWLLGFLAVLFGLALVGALIWRLRGDRLINRPPKPPHIPVSGDPFPDSPPIQMPSYADMIPDMLGDAAGHSAQYQTTTHNIRIESAQDRTRFVVDGVSFPTLEVIPDPDLRKLAETLLDKAFRSGPAGHSRNEMMRQVDIGNTTTVEAKSGDYTVSVQKEGRQTRYIVNGLTYYGLNEIPDPEMRRIAKELEKRAI